MTTPLEDFETIRAFAESNQLPPWVEHRFAIRLQDALAGASRIRAILEEDEHRELAQAATKASEPSLRKAWEDEGR